jgi:nanoRNase/pAp phosphatase (c-di-AMP/oligoRNAs hydrolase)
MNYERAQAIKEELRVTVYGPEGPDTDECSSAWELAKILARIEARLGIDILQENPTP